MTMDFTPMDRALAGFEQEGLDIKYLFLGGKYRVQLGTGAIFYRSPSEGCEYGRHGTESQDAAGVADAAGQRPA